MRRSSRCASLERIFPQKTTKAKLKDRDLDLYKKIDGETPSTHMTGGRATLIDYEFNFGLQVNVSYRIGHLCSIKIGARVILPVRTNRDYFIDSLARRLRTSIEGATPYCSLNLREKWDKVSKPNSR